MRGKVYLRQKDPPHWNGASGSKKSPATERGKQESVSANIAILSKIENTASAPQRIAPPQMGCICTQE